MSHFLTAIQIKKIFHLENIHIPIDDNEKKHLIITGKNGSGKTSLLLALREFLEIIINDPGLYFLDKEKRLEDSENEYEELKNKNADPSKILKKEEKIAFYQEQIEYAYGKVKPLFNNLKEISEKVHKGEFVMAVYEANRKTAMEVPENPEKPLLKNVYEVDEPKQHDFLKFLVDLKVQEALARNENEIAYADEIKQWFAHFTGLLKQIFEDENINLIFNFKDYTFRIEQDGRRFGFNELSDGYSAIIDIVADLILKMQTPGSLTRAFQKEGIVLIDEIETHLHLELQKVILPFLTSVFPNVQFIVTTHSPFVLNSLPDAVAYDLQKREGLNNLTDYSYEALAEGYFNVTSDSSYLQSKLKRYEQLLKLEKRDKAEVNELKELEKALNNLDENLTPPNIKAAYLQLKIKYPFK